jgi:predicted nucleic acid-binding Zn ribbon protein
MPTYVYKFIDTGETIEVQQSFDDDNLTEAVHPETGDTMPVKKVFLPVGITFKGDGFYKTDSRSSKSTAPLPSGSSDSGGPGASSESGSSQGSGESSSGSSGDSKSSSSSSGDSKSSNSGSSSSGSTTSSP